MDQGLALASDRTAMSDRELVLRYQKTETPDDFTELYNRCRGRTYSLCLRMLRSPSDAEELTQEVFLHLFEKIKTFRGESQFRTWLHRMTINLVLMKIRKKGLDLVSLDATLIDFGDFTQNSRVLHETRDLRLEGAVDRHVLTGAVNDLSPGCQLIFTLHALEGYHHREIAALLNCSVGNSKSQLHKARIKLRETLRNGSVAVAVQ